MNCSQPLSPLSELAGVIFELKAEIRSLRDEVADLKVLLQPKVAAGMEPSGKPVPLMVSPREAATLLGISPRKLWELTADCTIPRAKVGRRVLYRLADLERWAASSLAS